MQYDSGCFGISKGRVAQSIAIAYTGNGHGSTNTGVRCFSNSSVSGTDITYVPSTVQGDYFRVNSPGMYIATYCDRDTAAAIPLAITQNAVMASVGSTVPGSITFSQGLRGRADGISSGFGECVAVLLCNAGDIIRAHTGGTSNLDSTSLNIFTLAKVSN